MHKQRGNVYEDQKWFYFSIQFVAFVWKLSMELDFHANAVANESSINTKKGDYAQHTKQLRMVADA